MRGEGTRRQGERLAGLADRTPRPHALAKANMRKVFPDHWSFMLGEVCLYKQLPDPDLLGVYLTLFFSRAPPRSSTTARTNRSTASS